MDAWGTTRSPGSGQVATSAWSSYAESLATATSAELHPGDQLAAYEIEAVVGRGGMGVVYRAVDSRLGRRVALKLIAPGLAQDERFRERFLRESQLAASLDHSNVVPVYEAGESGAHLYIAMRFVDGIDLRTLLMREGPLDPERAVALVGQVADALDAAHARGLVHRDVKPVNILVTDESGREHCYLSDFGLSRDSDQQSDHAEPAHLSGTIAYTAPEQITRESVTGRADLYSLACVLYECLAGHPPFERPRPMAVLVAHVQEPPPPLLRYPELDPALARALAKDPSERPETCGELIRAARAVLGERELPPELDFRTPLVGREADLRWLRGAWREARRGRGRVVVISGPRGIGKTHLAAAFAREIRSQGGELRYASCVGTGEPARAALAETASTTAPILLVLDDLDAADEPLLEAVRHAESASASRPALMLATSRTPAAGVRHRELQALDEAALVELATVIAGDAAASLPSNLLEETGGVPRRVHEEIAEWLRAEASRRLGEAAQRAAAGRHELRAAQADLTSSVQDLQRALGRFEAEAAVAEQACPFKGLASFDVADADDFFGREQLVAEVVARLPGATLLGVVGPSGSGKSSIVRAGLSSALAGGALPGSEHWEQAVIRPGEHPLAELERIRRRRTGTSLLLVVDQLEEVFTICRNEDERAAFLDALITSAPDETVVVAVRADFYGRFAALTALASLLAENHVLVGPMKAAELRRAIELPARRAGLRIEPALVDALEADVADEPGGLPLLSTALVELWQRRDGRTLRLETYRESGGVRGAVARLAEQAYANLTAEQRAIARSILLRLAEAEGEAVSRRRAPLSELELDVNEDARRVLSVLTESRLVTVSEEAVEVAHEALLREWPRLHEWLEEDAEGRRLHRHVIQAAKEWDESGLDPAELYRGPRLAAALEWAGEHPTELNDLEHRFLAESEALGEREVRRIRRTNRRLRALLSGAAVFLAAALTAGGLALFQSREAQQESDRAARAARLALARELAFASTQLPPGSELGILLAREAVETTRRTDGIVAPEAQEALITANAAGSNYASYFSNSPDGLPFNARRLPSGERVLVPDIEQLLQAAHLLVKRSLTDAECREYLHVPVCPRPG
jgi:ABC-type branched-subunit amino acid transport system ATPase component